MSSFWHKSEVIIFAHHVCIMCNTKETTFEKYVDTANQAIKRNNTVTNCSIFNYEVNGSFICRYER